VTTVDRAADLIPPLAESGSRRGLARLVGGIALGAALAPAGLEAKKKKDKKRKKNKNKNRNKNGQPPPSFLDAAFPGPNDRDEFVGRRFAQTFTALQSGRLTAALVYVNNFPAAMDFRLELRTVDGAGIPTSTVLAGVDVRDVPATASGDGFRALLAAFPAPAAVEAGESYALAVLADAEYALGVVPGNPFPDGALFSDPEADGTFGEVALGPDMVFATAVAA